MLLTLIILYVITLIYFSIVERFRNYSSLIAVQGWLLLGIALLRLHTLDWVELTFIVTETLIFKALIVPAILMRVIKNTGINRIASTGTSQFNSLMLSIAALIISTVTTYYIADSSVNMVFFRRGTLCVAQRTDTHRVAFTYLHPYDRLLGHRKWCVALLDGYRCRDAYFD